MAMKVGKYKVYNARDVDQDLPYKSGAITCNYWVWVFSFLLDFDVFSLAPNIFIPNENTSTQVSTTFGLLST
jgi:hypothetical protein